MAAEVARLPRSLQEYVLDHCDDIQELKWKFAYFRNPEKALLIAAKIGNATVVNELVKWELSKDVYSEALRSAAQYGHPECVALLIPVSDPTANNSVALRWAAYNGQT